MQIGQAIATLSRYYVVLTDQYMKYFLQSKWVESKEVMEIIETTTAMDDAKGPNFPLKGSIKSFLATNNNGHPTIQRYCHIVYV